MAYYNKSAVHFGAGNIGMGFIGDLLFDSGYSIKFIDVDKKIINQINNDNGYSLFDVNNNYSEKKISNCNALSSVDQLDDVIEEINKASIITTAVLAGNLPKIAPTLLAGLKKRYEAKKPRINILACENALENSHILKKCVQDLDEDFAKHLDEVASFADTAVDRLVLPRFENGVKSIDIGKDFELAVDKTQLVDSEEEPIIGADYTDNLKKYIERKLYIINGGHVFAGFMGYIKGFTIIQDVFKNQKLKALVKENMKESGMLIAAKHGFTEEEIDNYIDFAVNRFSLPGIEDPISRVCRAPIRKLQPNERLVAPALECEKFGLKNTRILQGIATGFVYDIESDEQSIEIQNMIKEKGIEKTIHDITGIEEGSKVFKEILDNYSRLKNGEWIFD